MQLLTGRSIISLLLKSRLILFSLLFFVPLPLFGYSYLDEIMQSSLAMYKDESLLFSELSEFRSSSDFYHLVHFDIDDPIEKQKISTKINSFITRNSFVKSYSDWGFAGKYNYHNFSSFLTREVTNETDEFESSAPLGTGSISAWVKKNRLQFGVELGNSFSSNITVDTTLEVSPTAPITTASLKLPLTMRTEIEYVGLYLRGGYHFYRGLMTAQTPQYTRGLSGHYRVAPIALLEMSNELWAGIKGELGEFNLTLEKHRMWCENLIVVDNSLPLMPEMLSYKIEAHGKVKRFNSTFRYWNSSAYLYGYDSYEVRDRYIIFDNLVAKRYYGDIGYSGKKIEASLFYEQANGDMLGRGYIDYYPFSTWTIFKPMAFRYSNGTFKYETVGGSISYVKKWSEKSSTRFRVRTSYLDLGMSMDRKTKEVKVLIPVYVNDTSITYADQRAILGDIGITQTVNIKRATLSMELKQLLPIPLAEDIETAEGSSGSSGTGTGNGSSGNSGQSTPVPVVEKSGYGGIRVRVTLSIPLGKERRVVEPCRDARPCVSTTRLFR